ncbi:hypothetical protein QR680_005492 [Steinernema hermaphroditum]|uniref:Apoptogenic protein 1, mitochondrial n=1 Tax=Steinernema hermaphroditum TaxID=289476 RepID=A0AA39HTA6_9BILA|nr:hypothetical protein QR680_005492 [Steinernema hermaphroditum]
MTSNPVPPVRLDSRYDWVGPPDKQSKIRPIKLRRVHNETATEKNYRLAREELNDWNSRFWTEHNSLFERRRAEFVADKKKQLSRIEHVSANDMSEFYRGFLNEQYASLAAYNRQWYKRNFSLIWPALKVNLIRFGRLLRR